MHSKKRIGILMGGYSSEAHISELSAQTILNSLDTDRFEGHLIRVNKDGWSVVINDGSLPINLTDLTYQFDNETRSFDAFFNAIHGTPGEDGHVQGLLEMVGVPYAGCSVLSSALTFNKGTCNTFLRGVEGVTVSDFVVIHKGNEFNNEQILSKVGLPCFVKPCNAGSSYGISKVKEEKDLSAAIHHAFEHDSEVMIEKMVSGVEVSNGVYTKNGVTTVLPITEIVPEGDFFDYNAKYQGASQEITPARISENLTTQIQAITAKAYDALGLNCMSRIDYIIENDRPFLIEVNTVPGLSEESILPQQIRESGMTLGEFFEILIDEALNQA